MTGQDVVRDERTVAIENASYRLAFSLLSMGVLACVAYRGFMFDQACWDLLGLVIFTGWVAVAYQGAHKILSWRYAREAIMIMVLGGVIGAVTAALLMYMRGK